MSGTKPSPYSFIIDLNSANPYKLNGMHESAYEADGYMYWRPICWAKNKLVKFHSSESTFGKLPLISRVLTKEQWQQCDVGTIIGQLSVSHRAPFFQNRKIIYSVWWAKVACAGEFVRAPIDIAEFIPAINSIIKLDQSNLCSATLWKYLSISVRISSGFVLPACGGRSIEEHFFKRKMKNYWHYHLPVNATEPNWPNEIVLLRSEYLVSNSVPSLLCYDFVRADHKKTSKNALMQLISDGYEPDSEIDRYFVKNPVSARPYDVIAMSSLSGHNSQTNHLCEPIFRNFMRIFIGVSRYDLLRALHEHPEIREELSVSRPEYLYVPPDLGFPVSQPVKLIRVV